MHYFSTLFGKELYVFRTDLLSIIRSLNTVLAATGICRATCVDCLLGRTGSDLPSRQSTHVAQQIPVAGSTVLRILMMDSKSVGNM